MLNRMLALTIRMTWWLGFGICLSAAAWAAPQRVALLGSAAQVAALQQGWQGKVPDWSEPDKADVIITLGADAFRDAARWHRPRLALDVPVSVLDQARTQSCECGSVMLSPDPVWQLKLVRAMFGGFKRVLVVHQADDTWVRSHLSGHVPEGLSVSFQSVKDVHELGQKLPGMLERSDILVLQPSSELFNAESARFILLSSYRLGRPVIGPDAGFVKAGSLATAYAPKANIFLALHAQLATLATTGHFSTRVFPEPGVIVNERVAHSFDLDVLSAERLAERLGISHEKTAR